MMKVMGFTVSVGATIGSNLSRPHFLSSKEVGGLGRPCNTTERRASLVVSAGRGSMHTSSSLPALMAGAVLCGLIWLVEGRSLGVRVMEEEGKLGYGSDGPDASESCSCLQAAQQVSI